MPVQVLPSGQWARVERIVTADGDLDRAAAGQAVTLTLAGEIDVSRGDVIAGVDAPAPVTDRLRISASAISRRNVSLSASSPFSYELSASPGQTRPP
jgi:sulfate adenylyltransferase subunit 1 (EFTu-like GTPase family)